MSRMSILAVDPATLCGWAHNYGASGTWDLSIMRDESSAMRLIRLKGKLHELHKAMKLDLLVYEAVRYAPGGGALVVAGELQGVLKLWAQENGVQFKGFSSTEIKKHATTSGNASKAKMLEAAKKRFALKGTEDDNEIDAIWLLDYTLYLYDGKRLCPECMGVCMVNGILPCLNCEALGVV